MGMPVCLVCGLEQLPRIERCLCGFDFKTQESTRHGGFRFASTVMVLIGLLGVVAAAFVFIGTLNTYSPANNLPIVISGVVASIWAVWFGALGLLLLNIQGILRRLLDRSLGRP
jgi:hypothetical protein